MAQEKLNVDKEMDDIINIISSHMDSPSSVFNMYSNLRKKINEIHENGISEGMKIDSFVKNLAND